MCIAMGITEKSLYYVTFVNPHFIASMMTGGAVPNITIANEVIAGFNQLADTRYTLSDFDYVTTEEQRTL